MRQNPYVFTNSKTEDRYSVNDVRHVFDRAVVRTGITPSSDVTLHTLRHTALSRMIAGDMDDYTVMAISGHSATRVLARYTHPTEGRKRDALESFRLVTTRSQSADAPDQALTELKELLGELVDGGRIELPTSALRTRRSPS